MTPIVRVIAHTTFLGVPPDLLPTDKATQSQAKLFVEADTFCKDNGHRRPERTDFFRPEVVEAEARRLVINAEQDRGTDAERLIECAGRACYSSFGAGRPSNEYHEHILDVNHGSVEEHAWITFFLGNISRGCCYSADTLVLTASGWKAFPEATETDEYLTKDDSGKLLYSRAKTIVRQPYDGELLHFQSTELDLLVTPNHNMWVFDYDKRAKTEKTWKFKRADELTNGRYIFDRGGVWHDEKPRVITLAGGTYPGSDGRLLQYEAKTFTDVEAFAEFVGFWAADGTLAGTSPNGSGRYIGFTQTKPVGVKRVRHLIKRLGFDDVDFDERGAAKLGCLPLWFYLRDFGDPGKKSESGVAPPTVTAWPKSMLRRFIDGYMLGNGTELPGRSVAYCGSKAMAESLVEVSLKAGFSASVRTIDARDRTFPGQSPSKCRESYVVNLRKLPRHMLYRKSAKAFGAKVPYKGDVWCVELPKHHRLFVMRNGRAFWCGNTHELVRHRVGIAISQRSTRYVDESESPWAWHPLIGAYTDDVDDSTAPGSAELDLIGDLTAGLREKAAKSYDELVERLQSWLVTKGADKFTARKQARGAARGLLGNALCTEMVWTCNVRALRTILDQRAKAGADAEIRVLFNRIYEEALPYFPAYLQYEKRSCPDGIGYELFDPKSPAEKLKRAEAELENLRAAQSAVDSPRLPT